MTRGANCHDSGLSSGTQLSNCQPTVKNVLFAFVKVRQLNVNEIGETPTRHLFMPLMVGRPR